MNQDFEAIIADGILAPSGENCQPWRFEIGGNTIYAYLRPEADQSIYNFQQVGSLVAMGALIENLLISAQEHGYEPQMRLFPDSNDQNLIAAIALPKGAPTKDPLYSSIAKRVCNRKKHHQQKLSLQEKNQLEASVGQSGLAQLRIIDDPDALQALGTAVSANEEILFENKSLHNFFYTHLLWHKADEAHRSGFYWETLEFLPKQVPGIKLVKSWAILKMLNKAIRLSKQIAKENASKYATSGGFAAIVVNSHTPQDFVTAGRATERAWLTATKLGLAVHPCTGPLFFMENIQGGRPEVFSPAHQKRVREAYETIMRLFGAKGKIMPMLFRVGYADPPSAKSQRMAALIEYRD